MPRYVTKAASTLRRKAFRRLCHLADYVMRPQAEADQTDNSGTGTA